MRFEKASKRITKVLISLMIFSTVFCGYALSQQAPAHSKDTVTKEIPFVGKNDLLFRGMFNNHHWWFTIPKFAKVESATIVIDLSHSETLLPELSNLTLLLNGKSIGTVPLNPQNFNNHRISVDIPKDDLIFGYNEITLSFSMRSSKEPAADVDNPIIWSIVHKSSFMRISLGLTESVGVGIFDEVLCKAGVLLSENITFVVEDDPDDDILTAASIIANRLGTAAGKPLNISVLKKSSLTPELLGKSHIIVLGVKENMPLFSDIAGAPDLEGLKTAAEQEDKKAAIFLTKSPWANDAFIFGIMGTTPESVKKAALYIAHKDIKNIRGHIEVFERDRISDTAHRPAKPPESRMSFKSLGYPDMVVRGALSQEVSFRFTKPCNWEIKPASRVDLMFTYSSFLIPNTSGITIEINSVPVISTKFSGNSAKPFIVSAEIPKNILENKNFYVLARFYLDVGQQDISRRYADKAWVVIKGASRVFFPHVYKKKKDFSDFPSLLMKGDYIMPTTIYIPDKPSDDILSFAMTISSAIGAAVGNRGDAPCIAKAASFNRSLKKENIIVLGWPGEFEWYAAIDKCLPSKYNTRKNIIEAPPEALNVHFEGTYAIMQTCVSPWDKAFCVTAFSAQDKGYKLLADIFCDPAAYEDMKGNYIYTDSVDRVFSYDI